MKHRRSNANAVSAELVEYLVTRRGLSQNEIAEILEVDKSFVSRVRKAERDFSSAQMRRIADHLNVPLGAMLLDAQPAASRPKNADTKHIADLCEKLMHQADAAIQAIRQKATRAK